MMSFVETTKKGSIIEEDFIPSLERKTQRGLNEIPYCIGKKSSATEWSTETSVGGSPTEKEEEECDEDSPICTPEDLETLSLADEQMKVEDLCSTVVATTLEVEETKNARSEPSNSRVSNKNEGANLTWHVDVHPFVSDFSRDYKQCLQQIRELSRECFEDDATEKCSKKGGWHLTVMTEESDLNAFIAYKIKDKALHIGQIAVAVHKRRKGYGKMMIKWAINYARQHAKQHSIGMVSLSALKESLPFYKAIGFVHIPVSGVYDREGLIPGQEYFEYRIGRKNKGGKKKR